MIIGLTGLVVMAIPAFMGHGHASPDQGLGDGHGGDLLGDGGHAGAAHAGGGHAGGAHPSAAGDHGAAPGREMIVAAGPAPSGLVRFIPSPRAVFTLLALYGAFGNALVQAAHLSGLVAAFVALLPALAVERLVVAPLWNLVFHFQGQPSSPLEELIFSEARAVTPFRNGRGLVSIVRDGRLVQFSARLREDQARLPVKVGEMLRIEDVDAANERVTVAVHRE